MHRSITWQLLTFIYVRTQLAFGNAFLRFAKSLHFFLVIDYNLFKNQKNPHEGILEIRNLFEKFFMYSSIVKGRIVPL